MTSLEQQCEEIRKKYTEDGCGVNRQSMDALFDYIDELNERLSVCADQEAIDILNAKVYFAEKELAELRRPSDAKEIAAIQRRDSHWTDSEMSHVPCEQALKDRRIVL